eukprot:15019888-Alexandrium_andersonii.AAC.1
MVHIRVQTTPVGARRAAHHHVWPLGAQDADDAATIFGLVEVPRGRPRPWAQVECPGWEDSEA